LRVASNWSFERFQGCEGFTEGSSGFERFVASRERRTPDTFRAPFEHLEPLEPLERCRPVGATPTAYYTDLNNALAHRVSRHHTLAESRDIIR